jgi:hypothetical protein
VDYRNIKRAFVFTKALRRLSIGLRGSEAFVLLSVSFGYCNAQQVYEYLMHMQRRHNWNQVDEALKKLQRLGYLQRNSNKYSLSILGRNTLNDLEQLVRDCRTDK